MMKDSRSSGYLGTVNGSHLCTSLIDMGERRPSSLVPRGEPSLLPSTKCVSFTELPRASSAEHDKQCLLSSRDEEFIKDAANASTSLSCTNHSQEFFLVETEDNFSPQASALSLEDQVTETVLGEMKNSNSVEWL